MSKHEAELRRRLAADGGDIYDTMHWFLTAIDARAYVDGGPKPDLSPLEVEFLKDNVERYHEQRARRMTWPELISELAMAATPSEPNRPKIDMGGWSDEEVIDAINGPYIDTAAEELVKRANGRRLTVVDYLGYVAARDLARPPAKPGK